MPTQHLEETLLDQYAMGTLPVQSITEVEEHLLICSVCQSRLVAVDEFLPLFRSAATPVDVLATPNWIGALAFRKCFWSGTAAALTALLIFLSIGDGHKAKGLPAILLMQSLRGPEAGAEMASGRPCLLVFDLAMEAQPRDYEIEIVNSIGNEVLRKGAEVKDGRLALLAGPLARGSYWVRVYRARTVRELLAEYGLRAK
jgi:hypothetical protein